MSKSQIAGVVLAAVGLYSLMQGKKGADIASLIGTWAPLGAAAWVFFF